MRAALGAGAVLLAMGLAAAHPGLHHDIAKATEAIEKDPGNAEAWAERAFLERLNEDYPAALADLQRAGQLAPGNLRVHAERGMTLSAMGKDAAAERELTRFLEGGGKTAEVLAERGKVRERLKRPAQAIADYDAAVALSPEIDWYVARGLLQESQHELAAAAAGYRDGIARMGDAVVLELALLRVETARGAYPAALEVVDRQMVKAGVKTDWYLRRADLLQASGRLAEAHADRERALQEANEAVERSATGIRLVSRAKAQAALGKTDEAKRDLLLALEKSPRFTEARELLDTLGAANDDKGMKP